MRQIVGALALPCPLEYFDVSQRLYKYFWILALLSMSKEERENSDFYKRLHELRSQRTIKVNLPMPNAQCPMPIFHPIVVYLG
ncbi:MULTISPECIES: hypothetical protein [Calothrix]|uniref:Uncharacterized protein n=3 Tax=Calothrix TaxID=1186 RepID=A0ABR8A6T1_9CYAN|nr:hypothetical protein [Calothrix parietina]MBD2194771.1 hypothetical protein [Calothrix parietina FACHB-288]MBD2225079.1 hypothetical protein [Calothrix anomala FACHB-343]